MCMIVVLGTHYLFIYPSYIYFSINRSANFKSKRLQMFFKIGVLEKFLIFTGKQLRWSLLLIKLQTLRSATLLKRDSHTGVFL